MNRTPINALLNVSLVAAGAGTGAVMAGRRGRSDRQLACQRVQRPRATATEHQANVQRC